MGSESFEEYKKLVNEITKGMDLVKQFKAASSSSSSSGNQERALEKRLTSYEEALSILNGMDPLKCKRRRRSGETITTRVSRDDSDVPPDDGYNWRMYGQKAIRNSKYPRGYYKCSSVRGCPARKHVDRALDDPATLIVTYEGEHNHTISNAEAPALVDSS